VKLQLQWIVCLSTVATILSVNIHSCNISVSKYPDRYLIPYVGKFSESEGISCIYHLYTHACIYTQTHTHTH